MNLFGMDIKYIVLLLLVVLAIISGIKKLFKFTITIAIIGALYYLYTIYF